eukprot:38810-Amphidinium_carterae.1
MAWLLHAMRQTDLHADCLGRLLACALRVPLVPPSSVVWMAMNILSISHFHASRFKKPCHRFL